MKQFNEFIIERLKLNNDSKIYNAYNDEFTIKCCRLLFDNLINDEFPRHKKDLYAYCSSMFNWPASTIDDLGLDLVDAEKLTKKEWEDAEKEDIWNIIVKFCIKVCKEVYDSDDVFIYKNLKFEKIYDNIKNEAI